MWKWTKHLFFYRADVDECVIEKPCGQLCTNLPGRYQCHCRPGFQLQQDGQSCRKNGRFAKFKIWDGIFRRIVLKIDLFFTDTDENAFEARDLEIDFHDVSTTKNPTIFHGVYDSVLKFYIFL